MLFKDRAEERVLVFLNLTGGFGGVSGTGMFCFSTVFSTKGFVS